MVMMLQIQLLLLWAFCAVVFRCHDISFSILQLLRLLVRLVQSRLLFVIDNTKVKVGSYDYLNGRSWLSVEVDLNRVDQSRRPLNQSHVEKVLRLHGYSEPGDSIFDSSD